MTVKAEPLTAVEVAETVDYRPIWQAMLESPKDGTPCRIVGSEEWSIEQLHRAKAALQARWRRSGVPWGLHLLRGPWLAFYWARGEERATGLSDTDTRLYEEAIKRGCMKARRYRRSPSYRERIEKKERRRSTENLLERLARMPDPQDTPTDRPW